MSKTIRLLMLLVVAFGLGTGQAKADGETKVNGVKYLDANGVELTKDDVTVLTGGGEATLAGGWYVVNSDITYTGKVTLSGDVHLILADGAEMTVTPTSAEDGIYSIYSLTIYGQSIDAATMGQLTVTATVPTTDDNFYSGIRTYGVTIHGGKVTATGSGEGILSMKKVSGNYYHGDITLCGGIVEAKGLHGLSAQNVWYYGGQVTALGEPSYPAVVASSNIRLDWTNSSDFFFADNYTGSIPTLASGSFFSVDGTIYGDKTVPYVFDGNEGRARWSVLLGKTLVPAMSFEMDMPFVVKTFEGNWKVSEGAKTFLPIGYDLSAGQVTLAEVKGAPDGLPVVIGPEDGQTLPATYFLVAAQGDEVKDIGDDYDDIAGDMSQRFAITDGTKTLDEVISGTGVDASEAVILVLANGKFTSADFSADDLEKKVKAGLLLLVLSKWEYMHIKPGAQSASDPLSTRAIGIGNGEATGIEAVLQTTPDPSLLRRGMAGALWYDLQGRRIAQPKQKGIYIRDGKKTVIK